MRLPFTARRRGVLAAAAAIAAVGLLAGCGGVQSGAVGGGATADAANYPTGPVELQVGASAGGSTDLLARALAQATEPGLDETITVVNQPGANGAVAAQYMMGKPADGQVAMLTSGSLITITPLFVAENEAISLDDVTVVTGVGREDYVLVAHKNSGLTSIDDIANAGRNITYATAGVGTGGQLSQLLLFNELGIDSTDVPFEGGAPAVTALLGEQVDVASVQVLEAMPHIMSGDFVPLATFGEEKSSFVDVETATEQGYDVVVTQSRFVMVHRETPAAIVDALEAAFQSAFADPDYQSFIEGNYIEPDETDGEETAKNLLADKERYAEAAKAAGVVD